MRLSARNLEPHPKCGKALPKRSADAKLRPYFADLIPMTRFTVTSSAWYRCIRGCSGRYDVFDVIYRCPTCGGLLEVAHDEAALADAHSGLEWRALFDQGSGVRGQGSGVWAKHAWVLPQLASENIVSLGEGFTPLLPSPRLAKSLGLDDLWVKQCGVSHTGSFKDLGMTVLVSAVNQMMAAGSSPVPRGRVRVHRRHFGRAGCVRRCGWHTGDRLPAQGQDQHCAAHPADRQRRARAGAGH